MTLTSDKVKDDFSGLRCKVAVSHRTMADAKSTMDMDETMRQRKKTWMEKREIGGIGGWMDKQDGWNIWWNKEG